MYRLLLTTNVQSMQQEASKHRECFCSSVQATDTVNDDARGHCTFGSNKYWARPAVNFAKWGEDGRTEQERGEG